MRRVKKTVGDSSGLKSRVQTSSLVVLKVERHQTCSILSKDIVAMDAYKITGDAVSIAAILETSETFPWVEELISFTTSLINNHEDGWFDDVLLGTELKYTLSDSACDQDVAVRAYLNLTRDGTAPNAILGARCSGPTMAMASLASAENIALLSPAASNPKLTSNKEVHTPSRLVAPDDASGQAGALVSLLRSFGWDRISIVNTDTPYAVDFAVELARAWEENEYGFIGEIGPGGTVQVGESGEVDTGSVNHLLSNWPVNNPSINCRVVVLLAHHDHADQFLKLANEIKFQPDTVYIGVDAWTERVATDASWVPDIPGYIGIVPYRDIASPVYKDFMGRLQAHQKRLGREVTRDLQDSAAFRTVDSLTALAMSLSNVAPDQRNNGTAVVSALRSLKFEGISGPVEFNERGDRANPRYTVMTLPKKGGKFVSIGSVSPGRVDIDMSKICYAGVGCNVDPPPAKDPVPSEIWSMVLLGVLAVVVAMLIPLLWRFYRQRLPLKEKIKLLVEEIQSIDSNNGAVRKRKGSVYKEIARLLDQPRPPNWTDDDGLVSIPPTEKEYWTVLNKMRETMSEPVWITELSRVQNDGVWSYYVFRKNQLASKYKVDLNHPNSVGEIDAWHGTSSLNPDVVYNDNHDGFMMQYSQQGLYGRGLYFAERFEYSDCYSYRVNAAKFPRGSLRQEGEDREIFLVKLLVGQATVMNHLDNEEKCRRLVAAPENPNTDGLRYDTVSGTAIDQTKIHTVYENGRAYPSYLIRYYKGLRDPSRTPFETQADGLADANMDTTQSTLSSGIDTSMDDSSGSSNGIRNARSTSAHPTNDIEQGTLNGSGSLWMYENDEGEQIPFSREHQSEIENVYQVDQRASFTMESNLWTYNVDLSTMTQTNRDHPAHRQRSISRLRLH